MKYSIIPLGVVLIGLLGSVLITLILFKKFEIRNKLRSVFHHKISYILALVYFWIMGFVLTSLTIDFLVNLVLLFYKIYFSLNFFKKEVLMMFSNYDFSVMFLILAFVVFGTWLLVKRAQWFELLSKKRSDKKNNKDEKQNKKKEW